MKSRVDSEKMNFEICKKDVLKLGMCLEQNYSDSPSNEYSRHYSAESESEYLRRQNTDSKLGEEQKKGHRPNFDPNSYKKQ